MQVPVNVREDRDPHRRRTLAQAGAVLVTALVWVASGALLWRTQVPRLDLPELDLRDYFPADALERAADFRRVSRLLFFGSLALQLLVLGFLVWKARPLADALGDVFRGRIRTGVAMGIAVALALWLVVLPLHAVSHWWRRRYGLSEQGYDGWLRDEAVSLGITVVLAAIAVAGALALAGWLGGRWWLVGGPALAAIGVLFVLVQPLVIQPLFNRFQPLPDRELAREIERLGDELGVRVERVQVADASRRTTAANAYVAGIGPSKRVVLYDTILDGSFSRGELLSVSAHELAHVARSHLWKGLAWFALLAIPGVFLVAWLTQRRGGLEDPALVPLALLVALLFSLATLPFQNLVSRRYEREADWLALVATGDPDSAISLDRKLVLRSLGDPDPPRWLVVLLSTHPPAIERIAMAEEFMKSRPELRRREDRSPAGS
jgi:STE24 endopeptidase